MKVSKQSQSLNDILSEAFQVVQPSAEAKQIIAERWTVTEEVRKRRRSLKIAGKAPQLALTRPDTRGDLPRPRSSRPRPKAVNPAT